ncbi:hypothetical protein [Brevibacterium sp. Marseille-P9724]|uniref:hypothetical protein n=1 Tax=Brevibacterium sp. Marseille-P9724 TaxID=2614125 RepID=UPI00125EA568|nr:hypothetical protein [Brevibacterium sp. Marseille-P9724]
MARDEHKPEWDRLSPDEKVTDEQWDSVMSGYSDLDAVNSEVSADEAADYLAEQDGWTAPPAPKIGIRRARPGFVVSAAALLLGIIGLVMTAMFFRSAPGLLTAFFIASAAGGGVALLLFLPASRTEQLDDGAQV